MMRVVIASGDAEERTRVRHDLAEEADIEVIFGRLGRKTRHSEKLPSRTG